MVERLTFNQGVPGSIPGRLTTKTLRWTKVQWRPPWLPRNLPNDPWSAFNAFTATFTDPNVERLKSGSSPAGGDAVVGGWTPDAGMARSPSGVHDDSPQSRGGIVVGASGAVSVHPSAYANVPTTNHGEHSHE